MSTSQHQQFASHCKRYDLLIEYRDLQLHSPPGLYVQPDPTVNVWHGVMFVHGSSRDSEQVSSSYAGGIFRFKLTFPEEYPELPPTLRFSSDIFHPLVNSTGTFLIHHRFPEWKAKRDFVMHILHYLTHSFTTKGLADLVEIVDAAGTGDDPLRSVANRDAFIMFKSERPVFDKMASNCVVLSRSNENLFYNSVYGSSMAGLDETIPANNNSIIKFSSLSDRKLNEFTARLKSGQSHQLVNIANAGSSFFSSFENMKSSLSQFF